MRDNFLTILDGEYSKLLFDNFTEKRVIKELDDYLSLDMFPRFGGGGDDKNDKSDEDG